MKRNPDFSRIVGLAPSGSHSSKRYLNSITWGQKIHSGTPRTVIAKTPRNLPLLRGPMGQTSWDGAMPMWTISDIDDAFWAELPWPQSPDRNGSRALQIQSIPLGLYRPAPRRTQRHPVADHNRSHKPEADQVFSEPWHPLPNVPGISSRGDRTNCALIFMPLRKRINILSLLPLCPFKGQHSQVLPPT